jgi:hypothetical protein
MGQKKLLEDHGVRCQDKLWGGGRGEEYGCSLMQEVWQMLDEHH